MASRWVDSGIDWANLNLHKERTSWVIDELYRAFKERESILDYYTDEESSVLAWDSDANTRDENKLDEIMLGLQTWLSTPASSSTSNYSRFFDTTSSPDGTTLTAQADFLRGFPYFDSVALGSLETLVGVSLAQIRNWDVTAQRIDSDLLTMIYLVLAELNEIIAIDVVNRFRPWEQSHAKNIWNSVSSGTNAEGSTYANAVSIYNANPLASTVSDWGYLENKYIGSIDYDIEHINTSLEAYGFRNSLNVGISPSDANLKFFNYILLSNTGETEFSTLTYDTFDLVSSSAGDMDIFNESYPQTFTEWSSGDPYQTASARTYPVVNINNLTTILYYT